MHHAVAVGEPQGSGHIGGDVGGPVRMDAALVLDRLGQAVALDVLHDDEVGATLLAPVVDRDDVGVREIGSGLRLPAEALHEGGIGGELGKQDLDGDRPVEQGIAGEEDIGHSSTGDATVKFVAGVENPLFLGGHRVSD